MRRRRVEANDTPRVLVTDSEFRSALAACRGLAAGGYRVVAAAHWSRACHERVHLPSPMHDGDAFAAGVAALARCGRLAAIVPGSEAALLALSRHRDALPPNVASGVPEADALDASLDKVRLLAAAADAGVAAPASVACVSVRDAALAARKLGLPVVVKPVRSVLRSGSDLRQQSIALVSDMRRLPEALERSGSPAVVQRFERDAQRLSCGGVFDEGGLRAFVAVRFLRTWPPGAGAAAYAETVAPPRGLSERVEKLLGALGWRGIFELELLDLGRGRLAAIDLNPRVFGWLALAVESGVNLPAIWVDLLLGASPRPARPRIGVRYRWEDADAAYLLWQLRHRNVRAAAAVLRPHRRVVHAHFRADDPAPLAARLLSLARLATTGRRRQQDFVSTRSRKNVFAQIAASTRRLRWRRYQRSKESFSRMPS